MIELRVLGPPRVDTSEGDPAASLVSHRRRLALLAYLGAATPRGPHRRDTLLALFWPESDDRHARAALNQALYVLRSAIGEDAFLRLGTDEVALSPELVWCDVAAFEAALDAGRPEEALALYRADLLEGFTIGGAPDFEHWADRERLRLRHRASEGAWTLAEACGSRGDLVAATRWARRAAELVPDDEVVVRRLMAFLHRLGDRAAACRAYDAFAARMASEYELDPSEETRALVASIRAGRRLPAPDAAPEAPPEAALGAPRVHVGRPGWRFRVAAAAVIGVASVPAVWALRDDAGMTVPSAEWVTLHSLRDGPRLAAGVPGSTIALSPTGELVYVVEDVLGQRLFLKRPEDARASGMEGTEAALHPFFSPDGRWLGFVSGGAMRRVSLAGGPVIDVGVVSGRLAGASWGDDGTIVFATSDALWRLPASGGEAAVVAVADTALDESYRWPDALPGGRAAVFTIVTPTGFELATVSLASGEVRRLGVAGTSPRYADPGRIVFGRIDGTLLTAPFDARSLRLTGPITQVVEGVQVGTRGAAKLDVSSSALAYMPAPPTDALVLVDRRGRPEVVPVHARSLRPAPRSTGHGSEILVSVNEPETTWADIWRLDLQSGDLRRITFDSGSVMPVVRHGRAWPMAYATSRAGRAGGFELRLLHDASGPPETLLPPTPGQVPTEFTPSGDTLVFQRLHPETQRDIWLLPLDGSRSAVPYLRGPANERAPALSPDGRWLAWVSDESGRDEVYVGPFPQRATAAQVSTAGGREPRWSMDGRELFYRGGGVMVAVAIEAESGLELGPREALFDDAPYLSVANNAGYDVQPDGRFLMLRADAAGEQVLIWLDWMRSLAR